MLELRHVSTSGRLPTSVFHLIADGRNVGWLQIRHRPSHGVHMPPECASHVGYEIDASERRKGYGTQILRLAIPEAAKIGLDEIIVGCDPANIGSKKIIEANGGVYEFTRIRLDTFEPVLKYRIKIAP